MTINIVYSSYLCSRSTHEQHDPSTSVGVRTLWRHNVTQYNSTFNCIVHKIYQFIVSSQLYGWQFVSFANCEQDKVELISYFLLYVYTENDTEKFCWVDEKCKVHKPQRNTAKWAPDHKDNSKHVCKHMYCRPVQNELDSTSNRPTAIDRAAPVDLRGRFPVGTGHGSRWSSPSKSVRLMSHLWTGWRNLTETN